MQHVFLGDLLEKEYEPSQQMFLEENFIYIPHEYAGGIWGSDEYPAIENAEDGRDFSLAEETERRWVRYLLANYSSVLPKDNQVDIGSIKIFVRSDKAKRLRFTDARVVDQRFGNFTLSAWDKKDLIDEIKMNLAEQRRWERD